MKCLWSCCGRALKKKWAKRRDTEGAEKNRRNCNPGIEHEKKSIVRAEKRRT
jgi:hypothetical protein